MEGIQSRAGRSQTNGTTRHYVQDLGYLSPSSSYRSSINFRCPKTTTSPNCIILPCQPAIMSTIVLISGANRGIGKGLLLRYLALPNHTVIAANRNPDHPTSQDLYKLPTAEGSKLVVVKIDATVWQSAFDAVEALGTNHGIDHIDIVIANAGVAYTYPTVAQVQEKDLKAHVDANAYGVVSLYQAVRPLLQKSKRQPEPIYSIMGTTAGSLNSPLPWPNACYGPSKAASAWFSIKINMEDDWLHSFSLCPGWVHTDLGDGGADVFGVDEETRGKLMISVDDSCDGMMKALAVTTKAEHGGRLVEWTGKVLEW
ncbi:hypothetical protein B0H66DRAFT_566644 [Apodospora peruviana]|uniref:NAD(P)-binding protein n=1 Tax=Apodospora peruviana TaxID=516989 RepID=A0AAE0M0G7_9PEZI|nr:hypothetical protein B0H66DRAFT_566644 [Apodospora peruviana]